MLHVSRHDFLMENPWRVPVQLFQKAQHQAKACYHQIFKTY